MLTVKTAEDVERLRREGSLKPAYLEYLAVLFGQLQETLGGWAEGFNLEPHGYIVVVEKVDNPRDLQLYKVAVLYDNEYMMLFLSEVGQLDEEAESWLKDQAS